MSRREEYEKRAEELLAPIVELNGFELVDVEYVKEAGNWYLRGYIDKPGGITVNDCETVSRAFSDKLDENDFIEDSYILEMIGIFVFSSTESPTRSPASAVPRNPCSGDKIVVTSNLFSLSMSTICFPLASPV